MIMGFLEDAVADDVVRYHNQFADRNSFLRLNPQPVAPDNKSSNEYAVYADAAGIEFDQSEERPKYTERQLMIMPEWRDLSKQMYRVMEGYEFIGSDDQAGTYGMDLINEFNWNVFGPAGIPGESGISSPGMIGQLWAVINSGGHEDLDGNLVTRADVADSFLSMIDIYADTKTQGATIKRAFRGLFGAPDTYASLGGGIAAPFIKLAATKTANMTARKMLMATAKASGFAAKYGAANPGKGGMIVGGAYSGMYAAANEAVAAVSSAPRSLQDSVINTVTQTLAGVVIGGVAGKGIAKGAEVLSPVIKNKLQQMGGAADERIAEKGPLSGRLMSGFDPTDVTDPALSAIGKVAADVVDQVVPIEQATAMSGTASAADMVAGQKSVSNEALAEVAVKLPTVGSTEFPLESVAGKKVVFVPADMLDFGRTYEGLSEAPIEGRALMGGSGYGTLKTSRDQGLGFASLDPKIAKRIQNSGADYMLVSTMSPTAHRSNIDFANILHRQLNAYADEGFITPENKIAIAQKLSNDKAFPDLPDIFSPEGLAHLESKSFEYRAAIADKLNQAAYQKLGAPPIGRLIRETINPTEAGYEIGQGSVLVKIDKTKPPVDIREIEGGVAHPSYPIGLFGDPVAQVPFGVKADDIFDKAINEKLAAGSTRANAARSIAMQLPVAELTPERLAKIPIAKPGFVKSKRQALLLQDVKQGNWRMTTNPVGPQSNPNPDGLGSAEIIKAVRENSMSATLSTYTKSELDRKAKSGELVFYALGRQGKGDTAGSVYFGLNKNTDYAKEYGATSPELTPNEVSIVGVMNNEAGNVGKGVGSASILKALQEGATALDAYAVPTAKNKNGFLPDYYAQFGFEEVDRIPYNEKFLRDPEFGGSEEKYKKVTRQWRASGWDESLGNPDLVIMKWKGNENVRSTATDSFIAEGADGLRGSGFEYVQAGGGDIELRTGSGVAGQQRPSGSGVGSGDRGGLGDDRRGMGSSLQRGISELESLDPVSRRALGLEE